MITKHSKVITRRIVASLIDGLIIMGYITFLFVLSNAVNKLIPFHHLLENSYLFRHLISFFTLTFPVILYFVFMEMSSSKATFGKKWMNLSVETLTVSPKRSRNLLIRNVLKFLPWEIAHITIHLNPEFFLSGEITNPGIVIGFALSYVLLFIYLGMFFTRKDHRALYEIASSSKVFLTS